MRRSAELEMPPHAATAKQEAAAMSSGAPIAPPLEHSRSRDGGVLDSSDVVSYEEEFRNGDFEPAVLSRDSSQQHRGNLANGN